MSPFAPDLNGSMYNIDHVRLYLSQLTDVDEDADTFALIQRLTKLLEQSILELKQASVDSGAICSILSTRHGQKEFIQVCTTLIDNISKQYLSTSMPVKDKASVMEAMASTLTLLSRAIEDEALETHGSLFKHCKRTVQQGIQDTIDTQCVLIDQEFTRLDDDIQSMEISLQQEPQVYLLKIQSLHEIVSLLSNTYTTLIELTGTLQYSKAQLEELQDGLLSVASKVLKHHPSALYRRPEGISERFYSLVSKQDKLHAIVVHQLKPLTQHYLSHLLQEARLYTPLLSDDLDVLPKEETINAPIQRQAYKKIKTKIEHVRLLYEGLNDPLPCRQRIEQFKCRLKACENDLQLHRDPSWIIYCRVCIAALAILVTGVVPGLLGLGMYYGLTGRLSFFQSRGADYIQDVIHGCKIA